MKEIILRWYNWLRIKYLEVFTDRVKRIRIEDERTGKKHDVVTVRSEEKVCDHKKIQEIAPTLWKCIDCKDCYFQIGYKIMLTERDLVNYLDTIAAHLKVAFEDEKGELIVGTDNHA